MLARTDKGAHFEDLVGPSLGGRHEVCQRYDLVDQPDPVGFLGFDPPGGEHHSQGDLGGDVPGQSEYAARARVQADSRLGESDLGMVSGDDDVAGHGELESAAERVAVDRCDDGLPALEVGGYSSERGANGALLGDGRGLVALGGVPKVVARAERALPGAGDDRDPGVGVVVEPCECLVKLGVGGRMQRVEALGPVMVTYVIRPFCS